MKNVRILDLFISLGYYHFVVYFPNLKKFKIIYYIGIGH